MAKTSKFSDGLIGSYLTESGIKVKIVFIGFHFWKGAPDSVVFLRNVHRHLFVVEVEFVFGIVNKPDRQLEFFRMQEIVRTAIATELPAVTFDPEYGSELSCEAMAKLLLIALYDEGARHVSVSEDGENVGFARIV